MNTTETLQLVESAVAAGKLTSSAAENLRAWLTEPRYADYVAPIVEHVAAQRWQELDDAFWTIIPFGTGGRRGKMYPIGSNAINDRTIGESAQGLAVYVRSQVPQGPWACAIAYDTRHNSRHFAELCAEVMVANGFSVYFLDGYRSTPELSFAVRARRCACGIMVTASHNPPSDNAVKAYWSTGGQLLPPHDQGVIDEVMAAQSIPRVPFATALAEGRVILCQAEIDAAYQQNVLAQVAPGPRDVKIIYSPLHGVGGVSVMPVLQAAGFQQVELFAPHAEPNGDFPNVPGHVSNPENPRVFDAPIERAQATGADLVMATDPDADRLGCAARRTLASTEWETLTGNQIAALLADHLLERRTAGRPRGKPSDDFVVTTLVTSGMIRRIATAYGVRTFDELLVGFKWIAGTIDAEGPDRFVFGCEESHGYLIGQYVRDKDGTAAALLFAELAAKAKAAGQSVHERLEALYWQHGYHLESTINRTLPGSEGMRLTRELMAGLRDTPPSELGGIRVARVRDYGNGLQWAPGGAKQPLAGPRGDLVMLDLELEGNCVAVRPSGTEPKVKFYLFGYEPAEQLHNLDETRAEVAARLQRVGQALLQR